MKAFVFCLIISVAAANSGCQEKRAPMDAQATGAATQPVVAPDQAMSKLREGNERFCEQVATNPHHDPARRSEVSHGQHPFAVVLGCADSRVPPELIFDQGLGDLFVIRVAGEVAPPEVIGSIEYAVEHLGCRAIIVLGHQRCGAVEAAMNALASGVTPEGDLGELVKVIEPSLDAIDRTRPDAMDQAVTADAEAVTLRLVTRSKMLHEAVDKSEIVIVPAIYSLDSGKVDFLEPVAAATASGH